MVFGSILECLVFACSVEQSCTFDPVCLTYNKINDRLKLDMIPSGLNGVRMELLLHYATPCYFGWTGENVLGESLHACMCVFVFECLCVFLLVSKRKRERVCVCLCEGESEGGEDGEGEVECVCAFVFVI